ncbi:abortive infection system toxin AbiGii family protein [Vagococcus fluvialis]|uniref:abortive infection system toxin AbiGii family protein n=1 Tax=Vagococcus fluvialis TaxID=2738 RepID=UPI001D0B0F47|nr:abortive infection system toxin AbiGii family protein [Vagococcus fluvialis]UDM71623.1 hypothetical protein K5L00_02355 [Vagococcus fluvialis]UDM76485.1 hypothetical protein K5K98_12150 [Vagococcus fluvialis]UDM83315.1 hypothetical protein K5K96_04830 [Vagococcus fluvialis]
MSFKKAFEKKSSLVAPEYWLKKLNTQAPEGTHYKLLDDNTVLLMPNDGKVEFKTKLTLPNDLQNIKLKNSKELMDLMYRTQRIPEAEILGFVVNGNEVTQENYLTHFGSGNIEKLEYFFIPQEFPPPFDFTINMNGEDYKFSMKREPFASLTESIFKSNNYKLFQVTMRINEKTAKVNLQFHYNLSLADSVEDILYYEKMILDYASGKIKIMDLNQELNKKEVRENLEDLFECYKKLKKLEEYFKISFDIKRNVMVSDVKNIEKIYSSFILNKYYYIYDLKTNGMELKFNKELAEEELTKNLKENTNMGFTGYSTVNLNILGTEFEFIERYLYPKVIIKEIKDSSDNEIEVSMDILKMKNHEEIYWKLFDNSELGAEDNELNINEMLKEAEKAICIKIE